MFVSVQQFLIPMTVVQQENWKDQYEANKWWFLFKRICCLNHCFFYSRKCILFFPLTIYYYLYWLFIYIWLILPLEYATLQSICNQAFIIDIVDVHILARGFVEHFPDLPMYRCFYWHLCKLWICYCNERSMID